MSFYISEAVKDVNRWIRKLESLVVDKLQHVVVISPIGVYMAYRPKDTQERILHRLKIAKGQLENVMKMIEEDKYCIDVLHQMQAVESALKETGNLVLENHLKSCVADSISKGKKDEAIGEIMQVFKKKQ